MVKEEIKIVFSLDTTAFSEQVDELCAKLKELDRLLKKTGIDVSLKKKWYQFWK